MKHQDRITHQHFTLVSALKNLEELVWSFDSEKEARGHSYAGVPDPAKLADIVRGFLRDDMYKNKGDVAKLETILCYLEDKLIPAYERAIQTVHDLWVKASDVEKAEFTEYTFDEFRNLARHHASQLFKASEYEWFVEGFSKQWRTEWANYLEKSATE